MLLKIAWRNIWRNARRSLIVIISIVVGLVAILLNDALSIGMIQQIFDNQIRSHVSYLQIHAKGFNENKVIQNRIARPDTVEPLLKEDPEVQAYSRRVVTFGLVSSASNSSGSMLIGVEPDREAQVTSIRASIIQGHYLTGKRHEIIIGKSMAEKLGVSVGGKLVGMASMVSGAVGSDLFRVVGIFETVSSEFNKSFVYISLENAQEMLELGASVSEFAIITHNRERVEPLKHRLAARLGPGFEVLSYADLLPLMIAEMEMYKETAYVVYVIVGLAMIFGIINAMLMSVFERIHEFGVLMAMGMKNTRLFLLVLTEAVLLGVAGTLVGLLLGLAVYFPLAATGINLSMFAEGLAAFGSGSVIYPHLTIDSVITAALVVPLVTLLGAVYPALKSVRLVPVQAIRYV
jgi:putative ABC transport system permease protein